MNNFEGERRLRSIGVAWFVSYLYNKKVDSAHTNWNCNITPNSMKTRISKFDNSRQYHKKWLSEILKMNMLDNQPNAVGLKSNQIKEMAREILAVINKINKPGRI